MNHLKKRLVFELCSADVRLFGGSYGGLSGVMGNNVSLN